MHGTQPLTIVTVVYERELEMLHLQARSMDLFCHPDLVARVLVIDNTTRRRSKVATVDVPARFGALCSRTSVVRAADVTEIPTTDGWHRQQVLKLAVSELIDTPHYLVLDAKTHLVRRLDQSSVLAPDGRARLNRMRFHEHPLRPALEKALRFYRLPTEPYLDGYSATVPPFVLETAQVRALMADLVTRTGAPFAEAFLAADLTEFFAYTAFRLASGTPLEDLYDFHQVRNPVVWGHQADDAGVRRAVSAAASGPGPFFALHRNAVAVLSDSGVSEVAGLWADVGLFADREQARRWLARERSRQRAWLRRDAWRLKMR